MPAMWRRGRGLHGGFRFGFPPFLFYFGPRPFPRKEQYLKMLEEYKKDLEEELQEVTREIEELRKD